MADFLWLYTPAIAIPALVAALHVRWLRRGFHDGGRLPSVRHVAALAGGTARVTETVVASMLEREQARLGRSGRLYRTPLVPVDPLGRELAGHLSSFPGHELRTTMSRGPAMRALWAELGGRGLVVAEGRRRLTWRITAVVYAVLLVAGTVRWIVTGGTVVLIALLVVALALLIVSLLLGRTDYAGRTTTAGRAVLAEAETDRSLVSGAAGAVAIGGFAAYPDREVAAILSRYGGRPGKDTRIFAWGDGTDYSVSGGSGGF
ncbi:TIGR04222 domain-containing membrane protein [Amycolatopsis roodepoortensis]|uniref:TIGR04222 domain-containing membrane protein n=1 Tax=Amycolatopsis roodepoortensis TaxID=700274 RepID=UPI00214BE028|nr:TIGR04222 domain-containing membrane protein [Amycolatopsis roodepoortensis]UUV33557.1 TIGR04222 domain-containing membrane protein [Amycolatopsis roodepoortensis]